jgi:DNA-binding response OmpR family regulator
VTGSVNHDVLPSVLIIEESEELRTVFRTALARRGIATYEATKAADGLDLFRRHHPRVVILDLDVSDAQCAQLQDEYESELQNHDVTLLMLGRLRHDRASVPKDRIVAKPYHYGPLIRTIEGLL